MPSDNAPLTDEILLTSDVDDGSEPDDEILTSAKARRMLARRKLEEKEEWQRLQREIKDPLFDLT